MGSSESEYGPPPGLRNVYTSPGWFEGSSSDDTTGVVNVEMESEDGYFLPGCVDEFGYWLAPVEFHISSGDVSVDQSLLSTTFESNVKATDAAGNEKLEDAEVAWCPIIIWGDDDVWSHEIAIQKGDSILLGVTPFLWETEWVLEGDTNVMLSGDTHRLCADRIPLTGPSSAVFPGHKPILCHPMPSMLSYFTDTRECQRRFPRSSGDSYEWSSGDTDRKMS